MVDCIQLTVRVVRREDVFQLRDEPFTFVRRIGELFFRDAIPRQTYGDVRIHRKKDRVTVFLTFRASAEQQNDRGKEDKNSDLHDFFVINSGIRFRRSPLTVP